MTGLPALLLMMAFAGDVESIPPVTVAAGKARNLPIRIDETPMRIQAAFQVLDDGPKVRAMLLRKDEAEKFLTNQRYRAESSTSYEKDGFLGHWVTEPGEYELVIDNQMEPHAAARVELNVGYLRGAQADHVQTLPPHLRKRVVWSSLLLFGLIAGPAGYSVVRAFRRPDETAA